MSSITIHTLRPGETSAAQPTRPPWKNLFQADPQSDRARPLSHWLAHYPPGWVSRHDAASADPLTLATETHRLVLAFAEWLRAPAAERWDTFALQSLSASLFNRYLLKPEGRPRRRRQPAYVGLLQLAWPEGTDDIRQCLAGLKELLAPPLAVFKAVRCAAPKGGFPTPKELELAESALVDAREPMIALADELGRALRRHAAASRSEPAFFCPVERKTV